MKWLIILIIIAGIAGYFTRPGEAKLREGANAVLSNPGNISQGVEGLGASLAGERNYENFYVAERYRVILNSNQIVTCYGAFTQVKCDRTGSSSPSGSGSNP